MSDINDNPERKADFERVKRAATELAEHFDTVQIFVTQHMPAEHDGTVSHKAGVGNWFARFGQVREWLAQQDQESRENVKRRSLE